MSTTRSRENRVKTTRGTVHYTNIYYQPYCGAKSNSLLRFTLESVTCKRCLKFAGEDEMIFGLYPAPSPFGPDDPVARRAKERRLRQEARRMAAEDYHTDVRGWGHG